MEITRDCSEFYCDQPPRANGSHSLHPHPFAALFPMMAGKPMDDLVASIKTDGLQHPIANSAT